MPESNGRFVPFFQSSTKSKEARAAPSRAVVALLMAPLDETWRRDFRKATGEADYEKLREMIERAASPTRGSIVVVGDTPVNLTLLSRMLGRGYRVLPIPRAASPYAVSDPPELVLMDISMPEMDGFEVYQPRSQ